MGAGEYFFGILKYHGKFKSHFCHSSKGEYSVWCELTQEYVVLHTVFRNF